MKRLGTLNDASDKVLKDLRQCLATVQRLAGEPFKTPADGVAVLRKIRSETYEDLNQIQHEHFILLAARWLVANGVCTPSTKWSWNPRQTGTGTEPDLQGHYKGAVILSAEITTSAKPSGVIDTRMSKTLRKLAATDGARYYFVCTEPMRKRAETKVSKAGWSIEVVLLPVSTQAP